MAKTVFIAGASGCVGQPLCKLLVADGWTVTGTTRSAGKADMLKALGVTPVVLDVYDAAALTGAVAAAKPEVVIHQLTDLPDGLDPAQMAGAREKNARIREVGTANLVAAAKAAGAKRMIAQSIAFGVDAPSTKSLEAQVMAGPFTGVVLRYGHFYGPGTGKDDVPPKGPVHVEAAAQAAFLAATKGQGIYEVAEDDGTYDVARAIADLGWRADFRLAR
jgi:nucleoside-diphosphate-sugar epimerase